MGLHDETALLATQLYRRNWEAMSSDDTPLGRWLYMGKLERFNSDLSVRQQYMGKPNNLPSVFAWWVSCWWYSVMHFQLNRYAWGSQNVVFTSPTIGGLLTYSQSDVDIGGDQGGIELVIGLLICLVIRSAVTSAVRLIIRFGNQKGNEFSIWTNPELTSSFFSLVWWNDEKTRELEA